MADEAKNPQANSLQPAFEGVADTAEQTEGSASTSEPQVAASKRSAVDSTVRTASFVKKPRKVRDPWLVDPFAKKHIKALSRDIVEFVQRYLRRVRAEAVTDVSGGEAAGVRDAEVAHEICFDMKTVMDPADALVFNSTDSIRSSISKLSLLRSGLRNVVSEAVAAGVDGEGIPELRLDTMYEIDAARLGVTVLASGARHGAGVLELGSQVRNAVDRNGHNGLIATASDGKAQIGGSVWAPDVITYPVDPLHAPVGSGLKQVTLVCEVEDANCSIPALIRHLGQVAQSQHVQCVVGTKVVVAGAASQMVFFVIMTPPGAAQMTFAYDFGDVPLAAARRQNASDEFTATFPGMHQLPWIRAPQGLLGGARVTVPIPYDAIISGMSVGNPLQAVPAQPPGGGAWLPIDIDLWAIYRTLCSA